MTSMEDEQSLQLSDGFANTQNLDHCIAYLNESLVLLGLPPTLALRSDEAASMATACDCIYQLVQQRQADAKQRDDLATQRHRLMCDLATAESRTDRLEDELEVARRKIQSLRAQEQKAAAEFKAQIKKLQAERDELNKHVIALQQVKAQQAFELRKEKREFLKLQEKLASSLGAKRTATRQPGVDIVNLNPQSEGKQRATWGGKKTESDFYKRMMEAHERQLRAVGEDSKQLMAVIRSMQTDLQAVTDEYSKGLPSKAGGDAAAEGKQCGGGEGNGSDHEKSAEEGGRGREEGEGDGGSECGSGTAEEVEDEEEESMDVYALPPNMACPHVMDLHQRILTTIRALVERAAQQQAASAATGGDNTDAGDSAAGDNSAGGCYEVAALRAELEACRERMAEQELLICNYMHTPGSSKKPPLDYTNKWTPSGTPIRPAIFS
ncbi:hypothetical protein CLOM_g13830 [Closterium sp. NIES-68]|nr:hypothetical protein CLOM_g13830 [Closterium sp. NIES-68]